MANTKWLADQYLIAFRKNPKYNVTLFVSDMMTNYSLKVPSVSSYRAKSLAMEKLRGSLESHYAKLRPYVAELKSVDREGTFHLECEMGVFKGFYIGFSGLRKWFLEGCKHVISLDGAFFKTMIESAILNAIGRDENNQMLLISWMIILGENESTWRYTDCWWKK